MEESETANAGDAPQLDDDEIDISKLDDNKVAQLMKRDPKFITRLITDLDKAMHKMLASREARRQQIEQGLMSIKRIEQEIQTHVQPHLTRLKEELHTKEALREHLKQQILVQSGELLKMERSAAALIRKATHSSRGLMRVTASDLLQETRGFSTGIPTTEILKSARKK